MFTSRVAYAPLVEALHAAGQRESDIITVTQASQLTALTPDRRYKFCLTAQGAFRLSPRAADTRPNEFVHPILADGAPVLTAGALSISGSGTGAAASERRCVSGNAMSSSQSEYIGCGAGHQLRLFRNAGFTVTGLTNTAARVSRDGASVVLATSTGNGGAGYTTKVSTLAIT